MSDPAIPLVADLMDLLRAFEPGVSSRIPAPSETLMHVQEMQDRNTRLAAALHEALEGWEYAASYKGEYFCKKHGDTEDIARLRKLLE